MMALLPDKWLSAHWPLARSMQWRKALAALIVLPLSFSLTYPAQSVFGTTGFGGLGGVSAPMRLVPLQDGAAPGQFPQLTGLPVAEPLEFEDIPQDKARLVNSAVPFAARGPGRASPYVFSGSPHAKDRAIDCMASAMWYEAGNGAADQRAVGQVILNRMRHPAYPNSVCGVVFQGQERSTGCQFTFTCDGALRRRPSDAAFAKARAEARFMLAGGIAPAVGLATHYHTNWVHPRWSAEMDKIAQVGTHLFFRWKGGWGEARAMSSKYAGSEPEISRLAFLSPVHRDNLTESLPEDSAGFQTAFADIRTAPVPGKSLPVPGVPPPDPLPVREGIFTIAASEGGNGSALALKALDLCGKRDFCKVTGKAQGIQVYEAAFLYVRDRRTRVEQVLWDCSVFARNNPSQCLSADNRKWIAFQGNLQTGRRSRSK
ncbi:MAG: cell wall hydrolase [Sphingomonadaceae bacterium]